MTINLSVCLPFPRVSAILAISFSIEIKVKRARLVCCRCSSGCVSLGIEHSLAVCYGCGTRKTFCVQVKHHNALMDDGGVCDSGVGMGPGYARCRVHEGTGARSKQCRTKMKKKEKSFLCCCCSVSRTARANKTEFVAAGQTNAVEPIGMFHHSILQMNSGIEFSTGNKRNDWLHLANNQCFSCHCLVFAPRTAALRPHCTRQGHVGDGKWQKHEKKVNEGWINESYHRCYLLRFNLMCFFLWLGLWGRNTRGLQIQCMSVCLCTSVLVTRQCANSWNIMV